MKTFLIVTAIIITLAVIGYVIHLEFVTVPRLLSAYDYTTWPHYAALVIVIIASLSAGGWLARQTIFTTHERLVSSHLNALTSSIENVVSGAWRNDAMTDRGVFTTGAKLGFNLRDEVIEPDRAAIDAGLAGMVFAGTKHAAGQSPDVIDEMNDYLDQKRKIRLEGE